MSAGPGRGPIKATGSGTMAQGDLRGHAPRANRLAVSAVALVLGVPQFGHQLPGPGRPGPLATVVHRSSPLTTPCHGRLPANRERLAGVQGGGNEPPGRRHGCRRNPHRMCRPHDAQKRASSKATFLCSTWYTARPSLAARMASALALPRFFSWRCSHFLARSL
jgi:hypothetical protein